MALDKSVIRKKWRGSESEMGVREVDVIHPWRE